MPEVLTTGSSIECGHLGGVTLASANKLNVDGEPVLVKTDVLGKTMVNCTNVPPPPTNKPCTLVNKVEAGEATKLMVGGMPVLLSSFKGSSDGSVTLLSADAKQTKLIAQ